MIFNERPDLRTATTKDKKLTGRMRFREQKKLFGRNKLILQVEFGDIIKTTSPHTDIYLYCDWRDAEPNDIHLFSWPTQPRLA